MVMEYFTVNDVSYIMGWSYPRSLKYLHDKGEKIGTSWIVPIKTIYELVQIEKKQTGQKEDRLVRALEQPSKKPIYPAVLTERTAEMIAMRESGATLQKIGDRYNVSRERVRQIIGNTGNTSTNMRMEQISNEPPEMSNGEIAMKYKLGTATVSRYRARAWHAVDGDSALAVGNGWEAWANQEIIKHGHSAELQPLSTHYDILVDSSKKVDVKASQGNIPPSLQNIAKSPRYNFNIRKFEYRPPIDFYYLIAIDTKDVFIIPYGDLPMPKEQLIFHWPSKRPKIGKYQKYHNRYDLLET